MESQTASRQVFQNTRIAGTLVARSPDLPDISGGNATHNTLFQRLFFLSLSRDEIRVRMSLSSWRLLRPPLRLARTTWYILKDNLRSCGVFDFIIYGKGFAILHSKTWHSMAQAMTKATASETRRTDLAERVIP
jgi:hypothetical protein